MGHQDVEVSPDRKAALDAVALLSRKWHPVVLVVLDDSGPIGFNALLESIPGLSGKVLTETLTALDDEGLVDRTVVNESPLRVEYALTPAGEALDAVFDALASWATRHVDSVAPTVLVADGDRRLTEMYGRWLDASHTAVRAHNDEEFAARHGDAVDVVLVAESVPGVAPERVAETVRPDAQVVLVVEERPGFDVLGVECDGVVRKPLVREQLLSVVEEQLARRGASAAIREHGALAAKRSLLEATYSPETLANSESYEALCDRMHALDDRIDG
jgi:DNA-binding HxlR family transcriptional regulator